VLLTNFVAMGAPARTVEVNLHGELPRCQGERTTTLSTLDATSTNLSDAATVHPAQSGSVTVPMQPQSVALLRISC
jgi:hypothetical protein